MATAWPFSTPRKWDVLASGAVPVGLTVVQTQALYIQKIRIVNNHPTEIRSITITDTAGETILDVEEIAPKGCFGEVLDLAPYTGLKVNGSGADMVYRIHGWKGTGTI